MNAKAQKLKVVTDLLAFKASCDGFPSLKLFNSLPSLNNAFDAIAFILDLIKSVVGIEALKDKLIDMLSYEIDGFELAIKKVLKLLIKEVFSCGISPTIPATLISTGFNIDLSRVDFFDILKIDPNSTEGSIVYGNPNNDFNYFLYNTIQSGVPGTWKNLMVVNYIATGALVDGQPKNNVLNIKIDPSYSNKTIYQFLNNFIDSVRFLPESNTAPMVINTIFGTITSVSGKDFITIKRETEYEQIIEKVLSKSEDVEVTIDDTFFNFSNQEIFEIENKALLKQTGRIVLEECNSAVSTVSLDSLLNLVGSLSGATSSGERKTILSKQLTEISAESAQNVDESNFHLGELAFFIRLIKGLIYVILKSVIGPSMILILSIYFKLAYGILNFDGLIDFIKKNAKFYIDMVKKIVIETIQKVLLAFLFNVLKELIICNLLKNTKQIQKQYQDTLKGLTGKSQQAYLELISKLSSLGLM